MTRSPCFSRYRYWACAKATFLRGLPGVEEDAKGAEALRSLLKWTEADEKQGLEDGWTLLHWACLADDKVAVEELCAGKPKEYVDMPNKVPACENCETGEHICLAIKLRTGEVGTLLFPANDLLQQS